VNTVQPIRDADLVNSIAGTIKSQSERNYLIFMIGIYAGLRISDILKLKINDVTKSHINIRAQKTGKETMILINKELRKAIDDYINNTKLKDYKSIGYNEYLFLSPIKKYKPISRGQAWKIFSTAAAKYNIPNIGTHSLRKTFGYHYYKQFGDVATLQRLFGHDSQNDTLKYIGINQDTIDSSIKNFKIGGK
jgi:integrase